MTERRGRCARHALAGQQVERVDQEPERDLAHEEDDAGAVAGPRRARRVRADGDHLAVFLGFFGAALRAAAGLRFAAGFRFAAGALRRLTASPRLCSSAASRSEGAQRSSTSGTVIGYPLAFLSRAA